MTVTTSPANILPAGAQGGTWLVQNLGPETIYVARTAADATVASGVRIGAEQAVEIRLGTVAGSGIWAAAASGTSSVRVVRN